MRANLKLEAADLTPPPDRGPLLSAAVGAAHV